MGDGATGATTGPLQPWGGILELRKEKSRDAARSRRGKENYEFYELAKMLPLPGAITSQLDKASIIRLTISYLKLRDFSSHGDPPWQRDGPPPNKSVKGAPPRRRTMTNVAMDIFETHQGTHILQSLDGFAFALSNDGRFLYISETVSIYLGLSQVEMTGSSVFDYIHRQDQQEMAEQLGLNLPMGSTLPSPSSTGSDDGRSSTTPRPVTPTIPERASTMNPPPSKGFGRCFCIRMKSTLTKRGVHVKCSGYRVVQILSHMRPQFSFALARKHPPPLLGLVALAIALPPPTITELVIDNDMFVTRLSPEFKITYCEPRIGDMMDISADDLMGKNMYDYCHAEDLQKLRKAHVDLLNKGQVLTDYYRLMNKHGGFVWLQTCATIICSVKNAEEQNIIAINYILSGVEYPGCVMNMNQLKVVSPQTEPDQSDHSEGEQGADKGDERKNDKDHRSPGVSSDHKPPGRGSKRKHSPCQDNNNANSLSNSNHDVTDLNNAASPLDEDNPLHLINQTQIDPSDTTDLYNGDDARYSLDKQKVDAKNSRRKMDKPRKRKRDMEIETADQNGSLVSDFGSIDSGTNSISTLLDNSLAPDPVVGIPENGNSATTRPGSVHSTGKSPNTSPLEAVSQLKSPAPEDLSVRAPTSPELTASPQLRSVSPSVVGTTTVTSSSEARDNWINSLSTIADSRLTDVVTSTGSTVRDLEEVMNKHLPVVPNESDPSRSALAGEYNPSLLGYPQKHKSTIQWIGSQHAAHLGDHLPATSWLRTIYASRESVIRSNVYPRPQCYRTEPSMQNSLLTPPGPNSDLYKDASSSSSSFSSGQLSNHQAKTPPTTYSLMSDYSAPISVSMANNMTETYSMTPPSSVSPHDKYPSPFVEQLHPDAGQYRQYDGSLSMPIKPQAYPLPAHASPHMSVYDRATAASQYSAAGYYGTTAGFPSYNHASSPSHYRDSVGKNANAW